MKALDVSRNMIEDQTLFMLGELYKSSERVRLQHLNVSSCRVTDYGLLFFMEAIQHAEQLKSLHMKDNFISEECEKVLLELLDKNEHMTDFDLTGTGR